MYSFSLYGLDARTSRIAVWEYLWVCHTIGGMMSPTFGLSKTNVFLTPRGVSVVTIIFPVRAMTSIVVFLCAWRPRIIRSGVKYVQKTRRIGKGISLVSDAVKYPIAGEPFLLNIIFLRDNFMIVDIVVMVSKNCNVYGI